MAVSLNGASAAAMAVVLMFALIASSMAQSPAPAPAPGPVPDSSAGFSSPSFFLGCGFAVVSFIFGYALRI